jgi:shikimate 5-dehydrogenase
MDLERAGPHLDVLTPESEAIGAVNTVILTTNAASTRP